MYVGRIAAVGRIAGWSWAGYRVSSRSFPNHRAEVRSNLVLVFPRDPADLAKNPYIAYNCLRTSRDVAVLATYQADGSIWRHSTPVKGKEISS